MNSHKSAFLGLALGALVLGMTACESKDEIVVEIPDPAVEITITPSSTITLQVGQTAQVSASVTGGNTSTDRTVTFSSTNSNVATVGGNGTVTAVAPGTTTIVATNAANSLSASVQVIVEEEQLPPPVDDPTISIKSVTFGNTLTPVNINNVFGQIDVTLNVDIPAGNNIQRLEVVFTNGTESIVACQQTFTGGTVAADLEAAAAAVEIVCSENTAKFDANGDPVYENGTWTVVARLIGAGGSIAAQTTTQLVFNNTNHFVMTYTTSGGTATNNVATLAPAGSIWTTGSVTVTLQPVVFTGSNDDVASATITLTSNAYASPGCDNVGAPPAVPNGCGTVVLTRTGTAAGANGAISVTFPTATNVSNNVGNIEGIFTLGVSGSVTTGGQAGPVCVNPDPVLNPIGGPCVGTGAPLFANPLRLDNWAPRFVSIDMIKTDPTNRYFNDMLTFSHTAQGTASSVDGRAVTNDWGVDDQTAVFAVGPQTGTLNNVTSTAGVPETATNNELVLRVTATDDLGNSRAMFAGTTNTAPTTSATNGATLLFGIDFTEPTFSVTPNADIVNGTPTNLWTFMYSDAGFGPSGFPTTNQVMLKLVRVNAAGTDCEIGATSACNQTGMTIAPGGTLDYTNTDAEEGYYTLTANVADAAGNVSATEVEMGLQDFTPPLMSAVQVPLTITGGTQVTFTAVASDSVELGVLNPYVTYGGLVYVASTGMQTIGTFGPDPLTSSATLNDVHNNFIVSIESTTAGHVPSGTVMQASAINFDLLDVAGVALGQSCTLLAAGANCTQMTASTVAAVANGGTAAATGYAALVPAMVSFTPAASATLVDRSGSGGLPTTTTLSVATVGPSQTFANPFQRVEFWYQDAAGIWRQISGSVSVSATDDTVLMQRTWTHSLVWGPFTSAWDGAWNVVAVGVNANGRALISQPLAITIQP